MTSSEENIFFGVFNGKQSDRHNTAKNGGPLHPTLCKRTEHDDDDERHILIMVLFRLRGMACCVCHHPKIMGSNLSQIKFKM